MLNDIKDWATDKTENFKDTAEAAVNEVQTTGVMDWSGTVWLFIGGIAVFAIIGLMGR